jgi:tetratricopeptide (TPR) repeat protein
VRTGKAAVVSRALRYIVPALGVYVLVVAPRRLPGEYYIEKARVALRDQLFEESLALAQKALTFEERNPNLYFYIGSARRGMARQSRDLVQRRAELEAAAQSYLAALAIFPQDENALVRLAQALAQLGHFKQAEKAYLKALEMDPNLGVLHAYYARHLAFVGREKEAEERFAHALSLDASEKVHSMTRGTSLDPAVREE